MWFLMNDGFHSVVDSKNGLVVRARRKEHLGELSLMTRQKIIVTPDNDYAFRVFVSRDQYKEFLSHKVDSITYTNFKDSTKDGALKRIYSEIWWVLTALQENFWDKIYKEKR